MSSVLSPHEGERGQGKTYPSYFPIPTPRVGGNKEIAGENVLYVSKDKLVKKVFCLCSKRKNRTILKKW
jgi:hypothetical protein